MASTKLRLSPYRYRFERRRYGQTTFTWAFAILPDGREFALGDPWPCVRPKLSELDATAAEVVAGRWAKRLNEGM